MVRNGWNERSTVITVMTVVRLTYLYLGKYEILFVCLFVFFAFHLKKKILPLPAERLFCLYIQWVAYKFALKFLVYRGKIKSSLTVFRLILTEKN